jgi:ABC-type transport system substrate-binding protein
MSLIPTVASPGVGKLRQWVGDSIGNMCDYDDSELNELTEQLLSVSSESDEAVELWHDVQQIVVEDALSILVMFQPRVTAFDPQQLGGVETAGYTIPVPEVRELGVVG